MLTFLDIAPVPKALQADSHNPNSTPFHPKKQDFPSVFLFYAAAADTFSRRLSSRTSTALFINLDLSAGLTSFQRRLAIATAARFFLGFSFVLLMFSMVALKNI